VRPHAAFRWIGVLALAVSFAYPAVTLAQDASPAAEGAVDVIANGLTNPRGFTWGDFFVAQVGASAALVGLIFVGISISLDEIIRYPHLLLRAGSALVLLLATLVVASALLAPLPSDDAAGGIVIGVAGVAWLLIAGLGASGARRAPAQFRRAAWVSAALGQLAIAPFVVAGGVLLGSGTDGLYWLLAGFMLCFVLALADGWVLLVETHR
jgi:modulator of FtsH protease